MASQVYYNGNFWNCIANAAAGESPGNNPEKWAKCELPSDFELFLVRGAYALLLATEGQNDKAAGEAAGAEIIKGETIARIARDNGRGRPVKVFTR